MVKQPFWLQLVSTVLLTRIHLTLTVEEISSDTQVSAQKDGVMALIKMDYEGYETWQNRRLHTLDIWLDNREFDEETRRQKELAPDKWYTIKFYQSRDDAIHESDDKLSVVFSWNLHSSVRSAFTYLNFANDPLGPESVRYEITTNMFDIVNATGNPVNTSLDYTKICLKINSSHIMMWTNEVVTLKLFLRDIPIDLGNTKYFKFINFNQEDLYKIYYWDPTVFCWTDCYDDELPDKFHFDRDVWIRGGYSKRELGPTCKIVNCTNEMDPYDRRSPVVRSDFPRCVRLHHTPQGQSDQKVLLKCTNENYTYTACEHYPDRPCWYEVCDNYDLCNSARTPFFFLLPFLILSIPLALR